MKKLTRLDGTHHHCRLGDRTIAFQPRLGDENDPRPHAVLDDETARKVLAVEKGQYEIENLPEPVIEPVKTKASKTKAIEAEG